MSRFKIEGDSMLELLDSVGAVLVQEVAMSTLVSLRELIGGQRATQVEVQGAQIAAGEIENLLVGRHAELPPTNGNEELNRAQTERRFRLKQGQLARLEKRGKIHSRKSGRNVLYRVSEVAEAIGAPA